MKAGDIVMEEGAFVPTDAPVPMSTSTPTPTSEQAPNKEERTQAVPYMRRAVLKEELVRLTGDALSALILDQFLQWTRSAYDHDRMLLEEKARGSNESVQLCHGWISRSAKQLADDLMGIASEDTIRRRLVQLVDRGWLQERAGPNANPWDKTRQYRVDLAALQRDLAAIGYPLEGWPLLHTKLEKTPKTPIPQIAESIPHRAGPVPQPEGEKMQKISITQNAGSIPQAATSKTEKNTIIKNNTSTIRGVTKVRDETIGRLGCDPNNVREQNETQFQVGPRGQGEVRGVEGTDRCCAQQQQPSPKCSSNWSSKSIELLGEAGDWGEAGKLGSVHYARGAAPASAAAATAAAVVAPAEDMDVPARAQAGGAAAEPSAPAGGRRPRTKRTLADVYRDIIERVGRDRFEEVMRVVEVVRRHRGGDRGIRTPTEFEEWAFAAVELLDAGYSVEDVERCCRLMDDLVSLGDWKDWGSSALLRNIGRLGRLEEMVSRARPRSKSKARRNNEGTNGHHTGNGCGSDRKRRSSGIDPYEAYERLKRGEALTEEELDAIWRSDIEVDPRVWDPEYAHLYTLEDEVDTDGVGTEV